MTPFEIWSGQKRIRRNKKCRWFVVRGFEVNMWLRYCRKEDPGLKGSSAAIYGWGSERLLRLRKKCEQRQRRINMNKVRKTLCRGLNNCIHQLHPHIQKLPQTGELWCVANVLPKKKTKIPRISHKVWGLSDHQWRPQHQLAILNPVVWREVISMSL